MTISVLASDIPTSMITWPIMVKSVTIMMKISRITEISVMLTALIIEWINMVNKDIMCHTIDTQTMDLTIYRTIVNVMMLMLLVRSMVNIQNIIMK